jgi:hypothetical protein
MCRSGNHGGNLVVAGEYVGVDAQRCPGFGEDLVNSERPLGAVRRVLEHDGVAQQEVRRHKSCGLVVGEVPRHDAEQRADRRRADQRTAGAGDGEFLVSDEAGAFFGVVREDGSGQRDFGVPLSDGLAHLQGGECRQLGGVLAEKVGDRAEHFRAYSGFECAPRRDSRPVPGRAPWRSPDHQEWGTRESSGRSSG